MKRALVLLSLVIAMGACGFADDDLGQEAGDLTAVGPHATNASARIVYPEEVPPLGIEYAEMARRWSVRVEQLEGVPELELVGGEPGSPSAVAEDPGSGVAVDVIASDGTVELAQLTVVDGAGDEDDAGNAAAVLAFLEAAGLDSDAVIAALGVDLDDLHADDQDVEQSYQGPGATVFYAANEDTVLVGVFGPWAP